MGGTGHWLWALSQPLSMGWFAWVLSGCPTGQALGHGGCERGEQAAKEVTSKGEEEEVERRAEGGALVLF